MKITRIEPLVVGAPTPGCARLSNRNYIFVKVHTDEGITGLGEATLESHDHAVLGALRDLEALVLGEDPRRIEYLTQTMTRSLFWKGGVIKGSAVAGIELALWDILGKSLGEPVHRLVGGACRDKIRVYVNGWTGGSTDPGEIRERLHAACAAGYDAFKFSIALPGWPIRDPALRRTIIRAAETIRTEVGDDAPLMFDGHGRYDADFAIELGRAFEPLGMTFFEEPVQPEDVDGLARVAAATHIPVASGERLAFKQEFRTLLERHGASIVQPDLSHTCGFGEGLKIAHLADAFAAFVAPHGPMSPVLTAISLHLDAVSPNFLIQERLFLNDWRNEVITEPLTVENGYLKIPEGPGWGIELNEELCRAHPPIEPYTPRIQRPDGAIADW